ncbi:helix-turn-helix domain-containing protein [Rhizomonospora bruguierae]|uniref:helix-turn-helix domain-containing protein n=1 Tax=Rhizomonospora bruguierae TaxID=1581705 RepID=UPI001BCC6ACA|nr:helix-turn-helix transcriptional regulator [Micromonospora sp. NBRC 107566]
MKERAADVADASERAVLRAIAVMRERMGEQLTIDDLARAAMFSKFHFTRVFQRVTGISPGRFLSALRLQRAKLLLVSTAMSVADISTHVGYNSVGTFSSRFSRSVGMSPTTYRRRAGFAPAMPIDAATHRGRAGEATLSCRVRLAEPHDNAVVFLGIFPDRIPEGRPVRCAVLGDREQVRFDSIPAGTWFLLAQSAMADERTPPGEPDSVDRPVAVATYGPLHVHPGWSGSLDLLLRPSRLLDPPVLLALLDARRYARTELARMRLTQGALLDTVA